MGEVILSLLVGNEYLHVPLDRVLRVPLHICVDLHPVDLIRGTKASL